VFHEGLNLTKPCHSEANRRNKTSFTRQCSYNYSFKGHFLYAGDILDSNNKCQNYEAHKDIQP